MRMPIFDETVEVLRRHGRLLLVVAVLALIPALALTTVIDILTATDGMIINGQLDRSEHWSRLVFSAASDSGSFDVRADVLTLLADLVAVAVGLRIVAGAGLRNAWRRTAGRGVSLVLFGLLLLLLVAVLVFLSSAIAINIGRPAAVVVAAVGVFFLAVLSMALPAMSMDGMEIVDALRRSITVTHLRRLPTGTAILALGVILPALAATVVDTAHPTDVVGAGFAMLLRHVVVIVTVPLQVAVLAGAYRVASLSGLARADETRTDGSTASPLVLPALPTPATVRLTPLTRAATVAGLVVAVMLPAGLTTALVAANPRGLPEASTSVPDARGSGGTLRLLALDDGSVALVERQQVVFCRDARCDDERSVYVPCLDGPPTGEGSSGCVGEVLDGDVTSGGALVALGRGPDKQARLLWCLLPESRSGPCAWGDAIVLAELPQPWENWSMGVAATPTGGFVAAFLTPGVDDAHGKLVIASCELLDECPTPTVRPVLDVAITDGAWGGGEVAVAVDRVSGTVALGYYEATAGGGLWLGGCPAGCPDGPTLTKVRSWDQDQSAAGTRHVLRLVATASGPVAALLTEPDGMHPLTRATALACLSVACTGDARIVDGWRTAWPTVDASGHAFVVGTVGRDEPMLLDTQTLRRSQLVGEGTVLSAAIDVDGRLWTFLSRPGQQETLLVTCAFPCTRR